MASAPKAGGTALVIHLLAPNGRDVQVTSDLAGFLARTLPKARALRYAAAIRGTRGPRTRCMPRRHNRSRGAKALGI